MPVSRYNQVSDSQARTHEQPAPRWLLISGVGLAAIAGYVNAATLIGTYHVPISHMSGAVARVSIDAVNGDLGELIIAALLLASFLAGAVLSGTVIGSDKLMPGRRYGATLLIEAVALTIAAWAFMHQDHRAAYWAALACGIQNAMATSYCGLVIRTTHVTGIVTDIGILIGHWLRHRREEPWRMLFLSGLLLGFALGGAAGAAAWKWLGPYAMWPAAAVVGMAGCGYLLWRRHHPGDDGNAW